MTVIFKYVIPFLFILGCGDKPPEETDVVEDEEAEEITGPVTTAEDLDEAAQGACPGMVPGVELEIEELEDGVALVFTTDDPDQVEELRSRLRGMMQHQRMRMGTRQHRGPMPMMGERQPKQTTVVGEREQPGETIKGERGQPTRGLMAMKDATVRVEDVDGGGRLVFQARDEGEVEALQLHVRRHRDRMLESACPLMEMGMTLPGQEPEEAAPDEEAPQ